MEVTAQEKENIALVMRQSECYDVNIVREKLAQHNNDVVEAVCDLMNIGQDVSVITADRFAEIRAILHDKDNVMLEKMAGDSNAR
jgi:hypothetical protein